MVSFNTARQDNRMLSVDIVFCIDATGAMGNVINVIRHMMTHVDTKIAERLELAGREIGNLRVRVIYFRDFGYDDAIGSSKFYTLPEEIDQLQAYVNGIEAFGGGDEPENALEALAEAMDSDWTSCGKRLRHIIILFTDARPHKLEESIRDHPQYRKDMPTSLNGLEEWWEGHTPNGKIQERSKRLCLFAPEDGWGEIGIWENVDWMQVDHAGGCTDIDEEQILDMVFQAMRGYFGQ